GLAQDRLGLSRGVAVGGVDEVDSRVERLVDDPNALIVIGVAERAEHQRAQAELANGDARVSERAVVHLGLLGRPRRDRSAPVRSLRVKRIACTLLLYRIASPLVNRIISPRVTHARSSVPPAR